MRLAMKRVFYSLLLMSMVVVGCKRPSLFVNEMEAFATDVCACETKECAETVAGKYTSWLEAHQNARGSQEDLEATQQAQMKFAECFSKFNSERNQVK